MKEKKTRTSRAKDAMAIEMLPEMIDDLTPEQRVEIDEATRQHQADEAATAAAVAQFDKANGAKPNGQSDEQLTEPVKHLLTEDAHKLRQQLVNDSRRRRFAAETAVTAYFTAKGYSPEGKQVTKADLIVYMQEMESSPEATSGRMFSDEAFHRVIKHLGKEVKDELFKRFDKRTGIELTDELLMAVAKASVAVDHDFNLEIDGDFETCVIESCKQRFVPLCGTNAVTKGGRVEFKSFGNFLFVEPNDENELTAPEVWTHCARCVYESRRDAKAKGQWVVFLPKAEAEKRVAGWQDWDRRREERSFSIGAATRAKETRNNSRAPQKPAGKFNPELAARCKNSFVSLLNNREKDHDAGRYYSPEFEWRDKSGNVHKTFLDINVTKWDLVVSDAGPGLEFLIGTTHNTEYYTNTALFNALNRAADAQQAD